MSKGLSITIEATSIEDLANQLADLHRRFSGIANVMRIEPNVGEKQALKDDGPTPLEAAISERQVADIGARQGVESAVTVPVGQSTAKPPKEKKPAKDKAAPVVKPPTDKFFPDDEGSKAPPEADAAAGAHYTDDLPTEDCYLLVRARAKEIVDDVTAGGPVLTKLWLDNWAFIVTGDATAKLPEDQATPGVSKLGDNRERILRALSVFDGYHGIDPATGQAALKAADPVADLL